MSFKIPSISKYGRTILGCFAVATILLFFVAKTFFWILFLLTLFSVYFFRDPERYPFESDDIIVSPADGIITSIDEVEIPPTLKRSDIKYPAVMTRISIFLNVFDVHVNRNPISGTVRDLIYSPGKFINASLDKESQDNENNSILIEDDAGNLIIVSQIAGFIARRIVCTLVEGQKIFAGERFGIIKFGSRVNIYYPKNFNIAVRIGQRMVGGETIVAYRMSSSPIIQDPLN